MRNPITKVELERIIEHGINKVYNESDKWFVATFRELQTTKTDEVYLMRFEGVKEALDYYEQLTSKDLLGLMEGRAKVIFGTMEDDCLRISNVKYFKSEDWSLIVINK
tara:strand:- start:169 stop:492 length:324 start_codon:yes stop_codon:yes gene_type:complete